MTNATAGFRPGPILLRLRQQTRRFKPMNDRPHLSDGACVRLEAALAAGPCGILEYGAGASTLFFARRGGRVLSVETDRHFAAKIRRRLGDNEDASILFADIGPTREWGMPVDNTATAQNLARWRNYVEAPWREAEARGFVPDIVLVDGRFRVATAAYALLRLADHGRDGLLVFDDFARPAYEPVRPFLVIEGAFDKTVFARRRAGVPKSEIETLYEQSLDKPD